MCPFLGFLLLLDRHVDTAPAQKAISFGVDYILQHFFHCDNRSFCGVQACQKEFRLFITGHASSSVP